jgi:hypothetical protein
VFSGPISDRLALARILAAPGGERLSIECAQICAVLLTMPDPRVVRADTPIEALYHPIGKREFERDSIAGITKSLNHSHRVNQAIINDRDKMREEFDLKLRNAIVVAIVGWLPGLVAAVLALLKFL